MDLRSWRSENKMSQHAVGVALGLDSLNPASVVERVENGKVKADADLAEAIERLTDGAVTPLDLHRARLAWLKDARRARAFDGQKRTADSAAVRENAADVNTRGTGGAA